MTPTIKTRLIVLIVAWTFAFSLPSSDAAPTPDPLTGHYYERVSLPDPGTWDESRVDAEGHVFASLPGHLATISTRYENDLLRYLGGLHGGFIGLTDSTAESMLDGFDFATFGAFEAGNTSGLPLPPEGEAPESGERGQGFKWLTGELFDYQQWGPGSPRDNVGVNVAGADGVLLHASGVWHDTGAGATLGQAGAGVAEAAYLLEFDVELDQPKFNMRERKASAAFLGDGVVGNLTEAKSLLSLPNGDAGVAAQAVAEPFVVSFADPQFTGGQVDFARSPFLLDSATNDDQFAVEITAQVEIPAAGEWTFAVSSSETFELTVGENVFTSFFGGAPLLARAGALGTLTAAPGGSGEVFYFPSPGVYDLRLTSYERIDAAFLQLFASPDNRSVFATDLFALVGDELNGGLALASAVCAVPGDTNADCAVNLVDLNEVRNSFGDMGSDDGSLDGDAYPFDGKVDLGDLNLVRNNFGVGGAVSVPEQETWSLFALTALAAPCFFVRPTRAALRRPRRWRWVRH